MNLIPLPELIALKTARKKVANGEYVISFERMKAFDSNGAEIFTLSRDPYSADAGPGPCWHWKSTGKHSFLYMGDDFSNQLEKLYVAWLGAQIVK